MDEFPCVARLYHLDKHPWLSCWERGCDLWVRWNNQDQRYLLIQHGGWWDQPSEAVLRVPRLPKPVWPALHHDPAWATIREWVEQVHAYEDRVKNG